jgi:hypothetical protein
MIVLENLLRARVKHFTQLAGRVDFLCSFIWSRVSGLMRFLTADQKQQGVNICKELNQIASSCQGLSLVALRQSNNPPTGKSKLTGNKKGQTDEEQSEEDSHNFLCHRGDCSMDSFWEAKQSIPYTTVTFYGDCRKMCKDFTPNFGDQRNVVESRQCTVKHFLFHQGIFDLKQHDCRPPPTLLFCFPD